MEPEQNTYLPYDILTGECEAAIRKHLARTEILDNTGLGVEQAKACAVLSLWSGLAVAAKAHPGIIFRTIKKIVILREFGNDRNHIRIVYIQITFKIR